MLPAVSHAEANDAPERAGEKLSDVAVPDRSRVTAIEANDPSPTYTLPLASLLKYEEPMLDV
jgi:hypothetical protein